MISVNFYVFYYGACMYVVVYGCVCVLCVLTWLY
jgi:hypothetical protein